MKIQETVIHQGGRPRWLYNGFATSQLRYVRIRLSLVLWVCRGPRTYSSRCLLAKPETCTLGGGKKYIKRFFFLKRLREYFQWLIESTM